MSCWNSSGHAGLSPERTGVAAANVVVWEWAAASVLAIVLRQAAKHPETGREVRQTVGTELFVECSAVLPRRLRVAIDLVDFLHYLEAHLRRAEAPQTMVLGAAMQILTHSQQIELGVPYLSIVETPDDAQRRKVVMYFVASHAQLALLQVCHFS